MAAYALGFYGGAAAAADLVFRQVLKWLSYTAADTMSAAVSGCLLKTPYPVGTGSVVLGRYLFSSKDKHN